MSDYTNAIAELRLTTDRNARFTAEVYSDEKHELEFWVIDNEPGFDCEVAKCDTLREAIEAAHRYTMQPALVRNDWNGVAR